MADYPSYNQRIGTTRDGMSGIRVDRAVSGKPRFSRFTTQDWFTFRVAHECDATTKDALLSHYALHRMLEFDFTFTATGEVYKVQYGEAIKVTPTEGLDRWSVEALLIGTGRLPFGVVLLNIPFIPADNFEAIVGVTIVGAAIFNNWVRQRA